jgi:hypothetical protein
MKTIYISIILTFCFFGNINSQEKIASPLYQQAIKLDSLIFDVGFNKCNLKPTEELLAEDVEFYHDVAGTQNKEEFMTAIRQNICAPKDRKPIRKLVPGSLKVFPLYNNGVLYGMITEGAHEFYIKEPIKELYQTGKALFNTLWIKENDYWKAKRIYSYHHEPVD